MKKITLILAFALYAQNSFSQDSSVDRWIDEGQDTKIVLPANLVTGGVTTGKLNIVKQSTIGVQEEMIKFQTDDAIYDFLKIKNATAVDANFIPSFYAHHQSDNRMSLTFGLSTTTANDYGTYPLMQFDGRTYTDGELGTGGATLLTRPLCSWNNFGVIKMLLSANGSLGINTTTPSAKLHTSGTVRFEGLGTTLGASLIMSDVNGNISQYTAPGGATIGFKSSTFLNTSLPRFDATGTLINSQLYDNGTNIGIGGLPATNAKVTVYGVVNTLSDLNEKKNLVHLENALDIVNQLNGYNYEWKNSDEKQIGLIAQEVEKVLPEAVSENETGTKFLNYDGLIPVLTEAIKEQQKIITNQNDRIELLFKEIEKLKKKNK